MSAAHSVLIVEDDVQNRALLYEALTLAGIEVELAGGGEEAFQKANEREYGAVISDIQMAPVSGMDLLQWFHANFPDTPVVLLTAFGSVETAIRAMKNGAFDYLTKPVNLQELIMVTRRAIDHYMLIRENRRLRTAFTERVRATEIVGQSRKMVEVFKTVGKVSTSRASILIFGESGTGKELIARAIHDNSPRASQPFIAINCSAIPDNLLESELFGHVKGAFTNADRFRRGLLEEASGGTFFLDEVGDLSSAGQGKLLRVLQEGEIRRVGSNATIKVDLRILAASRRNLQEMVRQGCFRDDLLYRLKTVSITLPPLRERTEDIPLFAELFLARYGIDKDVTGFSDDAMEVLLRYAWPGNVRELEHVIEQAVTLTRHKMLLPDDLPSEVRHQAFSPVGHKSSPSIESANSVTVRYKSANLTRDDVLAAYASTQGNKEQMARLLGVSRWAMYRLLDKYEIGKDKEGTTEKD